MYCNVPWVGSKIDQKSRFLNTWIFEILLKNIDFPKTEEGVALPPLAFFGERLATQISRDMAMRVLFLVVVVLGCRCSWCCVLFLACVLGAVCCSWRVLFLVLCVVRGAVCCSWCCV